MGHAGTLIGRRYNQPGHVVADRKGIRTLVEGSLEGRREAIDALLPQIYDDLRAQAARIMRRDGWDSSLAPTALVHEAYERLADSPPADWTGRTHFLALAARVMRRVLVDHHRERSAAKRGAGWERVTLSLADRLQAREAVDFAELEELLRKLEAADERQARIVELRFFAGLTVPEIAEATGVSTPTVEREWRHARAWLLRGLRGGGA